jgi:hypothetical protein
MLRFQLDRPIMVKRWRNEWAAHGKDFGKCHCGRGMGTMRKHRPYESCTCGMCRFQRFMRRLERRQQRYQGKKDAVLGGEDHSTA